MQSAFKKLLSHWYYHFRLLFFLFCLAVNNVGKLNRCYFVASVVKARIIRFFKEKKNVSLKVHSFLLILNGNEMVKGELLCQRE